MKTCIKVVTFTCTILCMWALTCKASGRRQVEVINTSCDTGKSDHVANNLVYVKAVGENNTVHHVWSSIGSFVVFNALTHTSENLTIDCDKLLRNDSAGALSFATEPVHTFAVILTQLYHYSDSDNSGSIPKTDNSSEIMTYKFLNMKWSNVTVVNDGDSATATFKLLDDELEIAGSGGILLQITAFSSEDRSSMMPRLMHTADSAEVNLIINTTYWKYVNPRFALDVAVIGERITTSSFGVNYVKSIDDEYTPGVFKIMQLESDPVAGADAAGYVQWKPIVYTTSEHTHEDATVSREEPVSPFNLTDDNGEFHNSSAFAYYGSGSHITIEALNISFGDSDDEYFSKTNYSSWTFAVGYGQPPEDAISTFVIAVVTVGLGTPTLLLISGFTFRTIQRRMKKDDLHLSSEQ